MGEKLKLAMGWAAACGGCDVSLLDIEEPIVALEAIAEVVYWPVAMDHKRAALEAMADGDIDVGLFNGAIRTDEQEADARLLRQRCKLLCAYGSCACFGGIPGLGNLSRVDEILDVAYRRTPSTENPEGLLPQAESDVDGRPLTLPSLQEVVRRLDQVVPVDIYLPGCPPPPARILDLADAVAALHDGAPPPPTGTVLAADKALCDSCPRRDSRRGGRIEKILRPHEVTADPSRCFLEQGLLCQGIATRGGCSALCIEANMPCRGCFGPTPEMLDPAAEMLSAIGSVAGPENENDVPAHEMKKTVRSIRDPAGTFYRFTLPSAFLGRAVIDKPEEGTP